MCSVNDSRSQRSQKQLKLPRSICFQTSKNITSFHRKKKNRPMRFIDPTVTRHGELEMWRFYHGCFHKFQKDGKGDISILEWGVLYLRSRLSASLPLIGHILRSSKTQFRLKDGTSEIFFNHEKPIKGQKKPPRHKKKKGLPDGISAIAVSSSLRGDALQSFGVRLHVTLACLSRSIQ